MGDCSGEGVCGDEDVVMQWTNTSGGNTTRNRKALGQAGGGVTLDECFRDSE